MYAVIRDNRCVFLDEDIETLRNTLEFCPECQSEQIVEVSEGDIEQGYDGQWYVVGHAPEKPRELIVAEQTGLEARLSALEDALAEMMGGM